MANIANVKVKVGNVLSLSGSSVEITGSQVRTTGDLVVGGKIVATQYEVTQVTSSVIFTSGSTKFGDTPGLPGVGDTHEFTGSILVTNSVSAAQFTGSGAGLTGIVKSVVAGPNISASAPDVNGAVTVRLSSSITGGLTTLTGLTNLSSSTGSFGVLSASAAEFSGNVLIYGTAGLSSNPDAAYVKYVSSSGSVVDKVVIFPGIYTEGEITASLFSGSGAGLTNLPAANLTGTVPLAKGGTGINASGVTSGQLLIGSGSTLQLGDLVAGSNIGITKGSGSITIAVTGSLGVSQVSSSDPNILIASSSGPSVTASLNSTLTGLSSVTTDAITSNTTAILNGAFFLKNTIVTASYVVVETDSVLLVNTQNPITITLPGEVDSGRVIIVKKMVGAINTVTIDGNAVDGESTFELNGPYQSVTLISQGNDWYVT